MITSSGCSRRKARDLRKVDYLSIARRDTMLPAKLLRFVALFMIAGGVMISVFSIALGEMRVALLLIFPVFYAEGAIPTIGIAMLFLGMVVLFISFFIASASSREGTYARTTGPDQISQEDGLSTKVKGGGVLLIGPIPIVFGSDWKMAITAIVLTILLLGIVLLFLI
jgi:uncharacterized protein (TIGR00304 family)